MNGNFDNAEEEPKNDTSSQLFYSAIAKIAVAQICQSLGFAGTKTSALETLSDIATRYLQTLARSASASANSCRRTTCNVFDVILAIEHMNSIQGFEGLSNASRPLLKSGIVKDLINFVGSIDEIPFAKPLPRKKIPKRAIFSKRIAKSKDSHIPAWLPDLPDPSTYRNVESRVCREERSLIHEEDENEAVSNESIIRNAQKDIDLDPHEKKMMMTMGLPVEREKVRFKLGKGV